MKTKTSRAQYVTIAGRRAVLLEEEEYQRLARRAEEWEPPMPPPNEDGNYPADEALRVSIARSIIRRRRAAGWSQDQLAKRAAVRLQTLQRLEQAISSTSATVAKIDRALAAAERKKGRRS